MHALLIGINDYPEFNSLSGAVADVDLVKEFLISSLGVPNDDTHIRILLNKNATRDRIISSFEELANDSTIKMDDPILIFYAGHGSTLPKPSKWDSNSSEIQCLVAHDAGYDNKERTWVKGVVPDVTLASLLTTLAKEKGNNITVVLDCCHSGSGAR
ncbi:peptidase C14, caspase domain-containing protein, partial [Vararia minispora EC-137]